MKRVIEIRPQAESDIDQCAEYIAQDDLAAGLRFLDCVWETLRAIADWPKTGRLIESRSRALRGIRWRAIRGFSNHLVFYRLVGSRRIRVVRLLHAAMDREAHLRRAGE